MRALPFAARVLLIAAPAHAKTAQQGPLRPEF